MSLIILVLIFPIIVVLIAGGGMWLLEHTLRGVDNENKIPEAGKPDYVAIAAMEYEIYRHHWRCIGSPLKCQQEADIPRLISGLEVDPLAERQFQAAMDQWQDREYQPGKEIPDV